MRGNIVFRVAVMTLLLARPARAQTVADLFDDTVLQEIRLTIDPADWQSLHEKYLDNGYYRCRFEWGGITLENVGVRSRGSGTRNPIKPNLGFDFSKYVSSQRFLSLKSLVTRNFAQDPSVMREWLTLKLFTRMGLPSQREAFAKIYVNGAYAGLFLLVEPIDKRYLASRFGEDTGYLFEGHFVEPPFLFEWRGAAVDTYLPSIFEPKTHEDQPEGERLVELVRRVNEASDAEFTRQVGELLDLDELMAHLGVEQYVTETDGFLGYAGLTNFYLYRRTSDNRFVILPWDKDNAFAIVERSIWENTPGNVLTRRALADPALRQRFLQSVAHASELAGGATGWLAQERLRGYALVHSALAEDPVRVCPQNGVFAICPFSEFEGYQSYLDTWLAVRNPLVNAELLASRFVTNPLAPDYPGDAAKNLGAGRAELTPGAIGRLAMTSQMTGSQSASTWPLPFELGGITVTIGGRAVPVVRVTPTEVLFQVPWEVTLGPQLLRVTWRGQEGHGIDVDVRPANWSMLAVTHANWFPVMETSPAVAGEALILFGTGLGHPAATLPEGSPVPAAALVQTTDKLTVLIGNREARVLWAGWSPGSIGLAQVIVEVPAGVVAGSAPVVVCVNDEPSPVFRLAVR